MSVKAKATVRLKFDNLKQIDALLCALKPEVEIPMNNRVEVNLRKEGYFLVLSVEGKDTIALRATLNAYLRWISSTLSVINVVERS